MFFIQKQYDRTRRTWIVNRINDEFGFTVPDGAVASCRSPLDLSPRSRCIADFSPEGEKKI